MRLIFTPSRACLNPGSAPPRPSKQVARLLAQRGEQCKRLGSMTAVAEQKMHAS